MRRLFRLAAPLCALLITMSVVLLPSSYLNPVLAQSTVFLETFDGTPGQPTDYTNPNNWDIFVQGFDSREAALGANLAQHGPHCDAPGFPYSAANSHPVVNASGAVFQCNGHLMTSLGLTGYGAVYMTPPALMDFRGGTSTLQWDMSTLRTAARDWVDVVIAPYAQHQMLAYNNNDQHIPPDNIHIQLAGGGNVFLVSQRVAGGPDIDIPGDTSTSWDMVQAAQNPPLRQDAARRDRFQVDLTANHLRVCIAGNETQTYTFAGRQGFCWVDANLATPLSPGIWGGQATVQLDHRAYNPEKSCTDGEDALGVVHTPQGDLLCPPNTWHWDNVRIAPAVPYSVIKPVGTSQLTSASPQRVTFQVPAPPNTNLEFATFGTNSQLQVSFDNGATWQPAVFQPGLSTGHDENGEMVWMPVPTGVSSVMVRGAPGFWGAYESLGFNLISATAGVVIPPPTATPTTGVGTPASTPTAAAGTPTATPSPTSISTIAPTATPNIIPASPPAPSNPGGGSPGGGGAKPPSPPSGGGSGGGGGGGGGAGAASQPAFQALPAAPIAQPSSAATAPSAEPARMFAEIPSTGGDMIADAVGLLVGVPREATAGEPVTLFVDPTPIDGVPQPVSGLTLGGRAFAISLSSAAIDLPAPIHLSYQPSAGELALVGGDAGRLRLGIWTGAAWVPLVCAVDRGAPLLLCSSSQLGQFAVLVAPGATASAELELADGHFYGQANGFSGAGSIGFSVTDDDAAAFWSEFQRLGGVEQLGFPVSGRFMYHGFVTQVFQRAALQWQPALGAAERVNVFDDLNLRGSDAWLQRTYQVPMAPALAGERDMAWGDVVAQHMALLDAYPAVGAFYAADPDALEHFGLPMAIQDYGALVVVRTQRALLQLWTVDQPWAVAGTVVAGNAGDLAKEAGLWPLYALAPESAPATAAASR